MQQQLQYKERINYYFWKIGILCKMRFSKIGFSL
jgi:hypothetical protein